jgi:DNA-binding transcriptional MerR regulator/methylmalonyl-CoA mutase cobalamin-binding subunit
MPRRRGEKLVRAPRYPIRAVSKLTGISVDTLRAWERRYGVVAPERDERGRMYSEGDVERLRLLRVAVEHGHAIGRVAPLATDELRVLLARAAGEEPAAVPAVPADLGALQAAVERFDAGALRRELSRLAALLPPRTLAREVALPLLHLVGEAWHEGKLTVAQEHLVTSELRSLVGALARLAQVPDTAPRILFATPHGEQHEMGTLVAALLASGSGFAAYYLGPELPAHDLAGAARRTAARAVVLGITRSDASGAAVAEAVSLGRSLPEQVELWVGGAGAAAARAALAGTRAVVLEDLDAFEKELARLRGR